MWFPPQHFFSILLQKFLISSEILALGWFVVASVGPNKSGRSLMHPLWLEVWRWSRYLTLKSGSSYWLPPVSPVCNWCLNRDKLWSLRLSSNFKTYTERGDSETCDPWPHGQMKTSVFRSKIIPVLNCCYHSPSSPEKSSCWLSVIQWHQILAEINFGESRNSEYLLHHKWHIWVTSNLYFKITCKSDGKMFYIDYHTLNIINEI